jgi:phospholipase/lecithinase/hemolysin
VRVIQPDFESLIENIVGNGSAYGFKTLNRGFVRGFAGPAPSTSETRSVDEFLYFDEFHFTARAQSLMAKAAQESLANVI